MQMSNQSIKSNQEMKKKTINLSVFHQIYQKYFERCMYNQLKD